MFHLSAVIEPALIVCMARLAVSHAKLNTLLAWELIPDHKLEGDVVSDERTAAELAQPHES